MGCLTAPSDGSIGQAIKRPSVTELRVVTHHPLDPFWGVKIQQRFALAWGWTSKICIKSRPYSRPKNTSPLPSGVWQSAEEV